MNITLQLPTTARLVTADDALPIPVTLCYTSCDPLAVQLVFPPHVTLEAETVTWVFARSLLAEGLGAAAGSGSVLIRPGGPDLTIVELFASEGVALLHFDSAILRRFVDRMHSVVPPGEEFAAVELDHELAALFGGRA